jgi:hypothetical protein
MLAAALALAPPPGGSTVPQPRLVDEAPPPPPPAKPFGQRVVASIARALRPALPARFANGTDGQVVALGTAGTGLGVSGIVVIVIVLRILRRVPMSALALVDANRVKRLKSTEQRRGHLDQYLAALDLASADGCSIHESLVIAGLDELSLRALETAAHTEETARTKFPGWWIVLRAPAGAGEQALRNLRMRFGHEWLKARALAAIAVDPQLGRRGLTAEFMPGNDAWQIDFSFVAPSGLGANMEGPQLAAWRRIRSALEKTRDQLDNPHALVAFARALRGPEGPANPDTSLDGVPALDWLLFGTGALKRAHGFFTGRDHCIELEEALARHAEVTGKPSEGAGLAAYLAQRSRARAFGGVGTLLAFIGGARMKPNLAAIKMRQTIKGFVSDGALAACGEAIAAALVAPAQLETLLQSTRRFCAVDALRAAHTRAQTILSAQGVDAEALLAKRRFAPPPVLAATAIQHARRTQAALASAEEACERTIELLRSLAAPEVAAQFRGQVALGATVAALDESLVAGLGLGVLGLRKAARQALVARGIGFDT